jgi:hypothetical protein
MRLILPFLTRLVSALFALALIGVGVITIVEVAAAWIGTGPAILPDDSAARLRTLPWDDRTVVITIIVLAALGVIALLIGLWKRPPLSIPVEGHTDVAIERHALEQSIRRRIEHIDGVHHAKVRVGGPSLRADVETRRRHGPEDIKAQIESELAALVAAYHLALQPKVRLRHRGGDA